MIELSARKLNVTAIDISKKTFGENFDITTGNACFLDTSFTNTLAVTGLHFKTPIAIELLKNKKIFEFISSNTQEGQSLLFQYDNINQRITVLSANEIGINRLETSDELNLEVGNILHNASQWAGSINDKGEHEIELRTPSPGPHFNVNLLLGNRIGLPHALQTTPKSVVDRIGGGSFRSHADTQVLATRWDMRPEENGFPANRQFYIVENNSKIFYSADPGQSNIISAKCIHGRNHTRIIYKTKCGLTINRLIFILPQYNGLPLATEVQRIEIINNSDRERNLRIIYTGMFGNAQPMGQWEDVIYTNVIMQSRILKESDGSILAVGPDYYPSYTKGNQRFHSLLVRTGDKVTFPKEFCMDYNEFVGTGSLQEPQSLYKLSNNFSRKGPGFFAIAADIKISPASNCFIDNFTGLVSEKTNPSYSPEESYVSEITALINKFSVAGAVEEAFLNNMVFLDQYSSFLQSKSSDAKFNTYFNNNLPFQILYQTFVSRSFAQTQKGYRELGFREIQDIYASMYYFSAMGMSDFVKKLIIEWCSMVFEFGYAYHNFFWIGKEPGKWSDDALWLIQAVYRYINLTGDIDFLNEDVSVAGTQDQKRPVYETLKSIIRYSAQISIGKHGLPLIDSADWNDCLKVDDDFIDGPTKEALYKKQLTDSGKVDQPLESDYSESVMNAFLLKIAIDETISLAEKIKDEKYINELNIIKEKLNDNINKHAWKEDYFARVLINRYKDGRYAYLGAKGDGFSTDPEIDGVFFLNSFSWSLLSGAVTDEQIEKMLGVINRTLKTPYGFKLVSPSDLGPITKISATDHYFPGDRENGAVFKHACMMATSAMFKAAKTVKDTNLAKQLCDTAYWMLDIVMPYRTMDNPYEICGNPRFCTQYNNSETGENIGPLLSGTATWLMLSLMSAFGIEYSREGILLDPIMRSSETEFSYIINTGKARYIVNIKKDSNFRRLIDGKGDIILDGVALKSNLIPILEDGKDHSIEVRFN